MFEGLEIYLANAQRFIIERPLLFIFITALSIALITVAEEIITYWAARLGGPPVIERMVARGWLRVESHRLQRVENLFRQWGIHLVIFGRILPGFGTLVSIPAGLYRMRFLQYLAAALGGALVWNSLLVALGYMLGLHLIPLGTLPFE